jgi:ribonuclease HI
MEAAALLSGLVYLREEMQWPGTIEWHTESQSVIDTSDKILWSNMTHWVKQRDKDIWDPLRGELQKCDGRLNLHHVESHTDKKKNEDGTPRKVTPLEEMNQWAEKLADWAAWENITELQTPTLI